MLETHLLVLLPNIVNLLLRKKVSWVDSAWFFIFNTWKLKSTKIFKYEYLKNVVMWNGQVRWF